MARSVISIRMTTESWLKELEASDEYAQTHRAVRKYFKLKNDEDFAIVEFIGPYGEHQDPIPDKFNPGKTKITYRFGLRVYEQSSEDIGEQGIEQQWDVTISRFDYISMKLKKHGNTKVYKLTRHGERNSKETNYVLEPMGEAEERQHSNNDNENENENNNRPKKPVQTSS